LIANIDSEIIVIIKSDKSPFKKHYMNLKNLEVWFVTGSQHLYGEETLKQVAEHSQTIASYLNGASQIPVSIIFKPVVKTTEEIYAI
jgi:L-arabinose isomerase